MSQKVTDELVKKLVTGFIQGTHIPDLDTTLSQILASMADTTDVDKAARVLNLIDMIEPVYRKLGRKKQIRRLKIEAMANYGDFLLDMN